MAEVKVEAHAVATILVEPGRPHLIVVGFDDSGYETDDPRLRCRAGGRNVCVNGMARNEFSYSREARPLGESSSDDEGEPVAAGRVVNR